MNIFWDEKMCLLTEIPFVYVDNNIYLLIKIKMQQAYGGSCQIDVALYDRYDIQDNIN